MGVGLFDLLGVSSVSITEYKMIPLCSESSLYSTRLITFHKIQHIQRDSTVVVNGHKERCPGKMLLHLLSYSGILFLMRTDANKPLNAH